MNQKMTAKRGGESVHVQMLPCAAVGKDEPAEVLTVCLLVPPEQRGELLLHMIPLTWGIRMRRVGELQARCRPEEGPAEVRVILHYVILI